MSFDEPGSLGSVSYLRQTARGKDALADSKRVLGTWQERGASLGFWENRGETKLEKRKSWFVSWLW